MILLTALHSREIMSKLRSKRTLRSDLEKIRLWLVAFYVPSNLTKTEFC